MSFFVKQAINALTTETSDLQIVLDLKANAAQTYTMNEVNGKFTDLIGAAPATLDTLKEIANAVNNDGTFAVTINKSIDAKAPIADPTLTGTATFVTVKGITKDMVGLGNVDNTGCFRYKGSGHHNCFAVGERLPIWRSGRREDAAVVRPRSCLYSWLSEGYG